MNRDNNGDDAIVIIKDPPGENYKWIRNNSSSELQKFRFFSFSFFDLRKAWRKREISCSKWISESSGDFTKNVEAVNSQLL